MVSIVLRYAEVGGRLAPTPRSKALVTRNIHTTAKQTFVICRLSRMRAYIYRSDGDEENETCPTLVEEEHVRKTPTAGGDPTEGSSLPIPPILRLSLVSSRHSLWGHRLWNAALLLAGTVTAQICFTSDFFFNEASSGISAKHGEQAPETLGGSVGNT